MCLVIMNPLISGNREVKEMKKAAKALEDKARMEVAHKKAMSD